MSSRTESSWVMSGRQLHMEIWNAKGIYTLRSYTFGSENT